MESWNNRFRISNICVFDHADRGSGIGGALMQRITETAEAVHARMIVLETQSCNEAAIAFYQKYSFSIIGIDLYSYSNTDPEQHLVRIEMAKNSMHAQSLTNCKLKTARPCGRAVLHL